MAQPTNTFDTYDAVGRREDLEDVIYNISPTKTPFISNIPRGSATNTLHEWQTDTLAAASTSNRAVDGDDFAGTARAATTRLTNYTQTSEITVVVSGSQRAAVNAGRGDELNYQMAKAAAELKRDIESMLTQPNPKVAGNSTTAREAASLPNWIATNTNGGTGYAAPTGDGTDSATDGTLRSITETILKDVIQQCWTSGGEPDAVMCGGTVKQTISGFSGIATQYKDVKPNNLATIIGGADVYVSDFGQLMIVPNRFQRTRDCFVLETDMWKLSFYRPFQQGELAKTGDADKRFILAEYTLQASQEAASGIAADVQA